MVSNAKTGNVSVYDVQNRRLMKDIEIFNLDKGVTQIGLLKGPKIHPHP
ncbi:hypothetical protein [Runella rosea]|nr:hypothetical protein [Runella rosea]